MTRAERSHSGAMTYAERSHSGRQLAWRLAPVAMAGCLLP
jgi:hypothetical protein